MRVGAARPGRHVDAAELEPLDVVGDGRRHAPREIHEAGALAAAVDGELLDELTLVEAEHRRELGRRRDRVLDQVGRRRDVVGGLGGRERDAAAIDDRAAPGKDLLRGLLLRGGGVRETAALDHAHVPCLERRRGEAGKEDAEQDAEALLDERQRISPRPRDRLWRPRSASSGVVAAAGAVAVAGAWPAAGVATPVWAGAVAWAGAVVCAAGAAPV